MSGYDEAYYQRPDAPEFWFAPMGLLRPDQLAAVCYLWGVPFWGTERIGRRTPRRVLSIGAGEGHLESYLESCGVDVVGVETSEAARRLYLGRTVLERADAEQVRWADSLVFVESLEHVVRAEIDRLLGLVAPNTRIVVTNWPDFFPLEPDGTGWDHVTRLDDELYDAIAACGTPKLRRGSHLVVDA